MHVVAENYEQTHTRARTRGTTTVTIIIKTIRSAEAHTYIRMQNRSTLSTCANLE